MSLSRNTLMSPMDRITHWQPRKDRTNNACTKATNANHSKSMPDTRKLLTELRKKLETAIEEQKKQLIQKLKNKRERTPTEQRQQVR